MKGENFGRFSDQSCVEKLLDLPGAQPINVERLARHKMDQPLAGLRGADEPTGAAPDGIGLARLLVMFAHRIAAADRTGVAEDIGFRARRALVQHHFDDLRDDIARTLDHDGVADAHILADNLVLVVQRGVRYNDAAHGDGFQLGHRGQRAGAADLDFDGIELGGRLFRREFVRDGPTRCARDLTQPFLPVEPVDLVDDPVNVIAEFGTASFQLAVIIEQPVGAVRPDHVVIDDKARRLQSLNGLVLRRGQRFGDLAPRIGEEAQGTHCRDRRIDLAQRPGGGVAGILVLGLVRRALTGIERFKVGVADIHLAAHLQHIRHVTGQGLRDLCDRAKIGCHVLAGFTVTARGAMDKATFFIAQAGRQAIDLGLGGDRQGFVVFQSEETSDAGQEIGHILVGEGIAEGQHRAGMANLAKLARRPGADRLGRAVGCNEVREAGFKGLQPLAQGVIGGIGNFRPVLLVIGAVVGPDLLHQPLVFGVTLGAGQCIDVLERTHAVPISWSACARAASVTFSPDSMRATSSRRSSPDRATSVVRTPPFPSSIFSIFQ